MNDIINAPSNSTSGKLFYSLRCVNSDLNTDQAPPTAKETARGPRYATTMLFLRTQLAAPLCTIVPANHWHTLRAKSRRQGSPVKVDYVSISIFIRSPRVRC